MICVTPRPKDGLPWAWPTNRLVLAICLAVSACTVRQARHVWLGPAYPPWPSGHSVEVFRDGLPARPFLRISRLDVHIEKTDFRKASFDEALPQLLNQARLSGADAVIEIRERRTWVVGSRAYHVTATGIRYTEPAN